MRKPRRSPRWLAWVAGLTLITVPASALAASGTTGTYHASGAVRFTFRVKAARCYLFKLDPFRGRKLGHGICFSSTAEVPYKLSCPDGTQVSGTRADLSFYDSRFSPAGVIHIREAGTPGEVELMLKLGRGGHVTGFLRGTYRDQSGGSCDSGKLHFTAKKA